MKHNHTVLYKTETGNSNNKKKEIQNTFASFFHQQNVTVNTKFKPQQRNMY